MFDEDEGVVRSGSNHGAAAAAGLVGNNTVVTTRMIGGVEQVLVYGKNGAPPSAATATLPQHHNPDAELITWVHGDGRVEQTQAVFHHNTGDGVRFTGGNGASILSTARNAMMEPTGNYDRLGVSVCLEPGNEGTRTSIKNAVSQGYLQQGPNGYQEVPQQSINAPTSQPSQQQQPQQQQPTQQTQQATNSFSEMSNKAMDLLERTFGEGAVAEALSAALVKGKVDIRALSEIGGISEEDVQKFVELGHGTIGIEMYKAMKSTGVADNDYNLATDWMRTNRPGAYKSAIAELAHGRSTALIKSLTAEYLSKQLPSAQALKAAGIKHWVSGGVEYIEHPKHGVTTLRGAMNNGWV